MFNGKVNLSGLHSKDSNEYKYFKQQVSKYAKYKNGDYIIENIMLPVNNSFQFKEEINTIGVGKNENHPKDIDLSQR